MRRSRLSSMDRRVRSLHSGRLRGVLGLRRRFNRVSVVSMPLLVLQVAPEGVVPAAAQDEQAQVEGDLAAVGAPAHARLLEPLAEQGLAAGLGDAAAEG